MHITSLMHVSTVSDVHCLIVFNISISTKSLSRICIIFLNLRKNVKRIVILKILPSFSANIVTHWRNLKLYDQKIFLKIYCFTSNDVEKGSFFSKLYLLFTFKIGHLFSGQYVCNSLFYIQCTIYLY